MPSLDFVKDLLESLEKQDIEYLLAIVVKTKEGQQLRVFSSDEDNGALIAKTLKKMKENKNAKK